MKFILRLDPNTPTNELHRDIDILRISDMCKSYILDFVNEILAWRCPESFKHYFQYKR